jgi:hypothetical protein
MAKGGLELFIFFVETINCLGMLISRGRTAAIYLLLLECP